MKNEKKNRRNTRKILGEKTKARREEMTYNEYIIKIQVKKHEGEKFRVVMINDKSSQHSLRCNDRKAVMKFLKDELVLRDIK